MGLPYHALREAAEKNEKQGLALALDLLRPPESVVLDGQPGRFMGNGNRGPLWLPKGQRKYGYTIKPTFTLSNDRLGSIWDGKRSKERIEAASKQDDIECQALCESYIGQFMSVEGHTYVGDHYDKSYGLICVRVHPEPCGGGKAIHLNGTCEKEWAVAYSARLPECLADNLEDAEAKSAAWRERMLEMERKQQEQEREKEQKQQDKTLAAMRHLEGELPTGESKAAVVRRFSKGSRWLRVWSSCRENQEEFVVKEVKTTALSVTYFIDGKEVDFRMDVSGKDNEVIGYTNGCVLTARQGLPTNIYRKTA